MGGKNEWCYVHRKAFSGRTVIRLVTCYPTSPQDDNKYRLQITNGPYTEQISLGKCDFAAALERFEALNGK